MLLLHISIPIFRVFWEVNVALKFTIICYCLLLLHTTYFFVSFHSRCCQVHHNVLLACTIFYVLLFLFFCNKSFFKYMHVLLKFHFQISITNCVPAFLNVQFQTMCIQTWFGIVPSYEFQEPNTWTSKHYIWHWSSISMSWDIWHWSQFNTKVLNVYIQTQC